MLNSPLVSVLIPAYNHEKYVQETIESIINQSYKNIELIIVDDGSSDSTWEKIQSLESVCRERFVGVIFRSRKNVGTCETLNELVSLARGEYIYLTASDDLTKRHAIAKEVDFLENNPDYVLCVGDNEFIDFESKQVYWDEKQSLVYDINQAKYKTFGYFLQSKKRNVNFYSDDFGSYASLYTGNYIPNGFMLRSSIYKEIGQYTKEAPLEDYWLLLQLSKYAKFKYFDEVLCSYRWHNTNTANNRVHMEKMTDRTILYEKRLVARADKSKWKSDVRDFTAKIVLERSTKGKKHFFEIITEHSCLYKTIQIKLLGIRIYKKKMLLENTLL